LPSKVYSRCLETALRYRDDAEDEIETKSSREIKHIKTHAFVRTAEKILGLE
jgi:hypothetical protein